jgi:hypothetical protein
MSYPPQPPPPGPYGPAAQQQNGLGVAGFVLGLVGLVFSIIPFVQVIAWPLVIVGVVLSAVGIAKVQKGQANNMGLAVAGLVTAIIGLFMCIAWASFWAGF